MIEKTEKELLYEYIDICYRFCQLSYDDVEAIKNTFGFQQYKLHCEVEYLNYLIRDALFGWVYELELRIRGVMI